MIVLGGARCMLIRKWEASVVREALQHHLDSAQLNMLTR